MRIQLVLPLFCLQCCPVFSASLFPTFSFIALKSLPQITDVSNGSYPARNTFSPLFIAVSCTAFSFFSAFPSAHSRPQHCKFPGAVWFSVFPFIWPLPLALRIPESQTQGSRTKLSPPKSVAPLWLTGVSEEGLARKILIGCSKG